MILLGRKYKESLGGKKHLPAFQTSGVCTAIRRYIRNHLIANKKMMPVQRYLERKSETLYIMDPQAHTGSSRQWSLCAVSNHLRDTEVSERLQTERRKMSWARGRK